jgi:hypothetical protein
MDLGDCAGKNASTNLSELLNTTFMGVIREVRNGNNDQTSNMQLQASYTDVRHWEELSDFIKKTLLPERTILCDWDVHMKLEAG